MGLIRRILSNENKSNNCRFHNGGALGYERLHGEYPIGIYRVYSPERKLLGLGEITEEKGDLNVRRVLVEE